MTSPSRTLTPAARKLTMVAGAKFHQGLSSLDSAEHPQAEMLKSAMDVARFVFADGRWKNRSRQLLENSKLNKSILATEARGMKVPGGYDLATPEVGLLLEAVLDIYQSNSYDTRSSRRVASLYEMVVASIQTR